MNYLSKSFKDRILELAGINTSVILPDVLYHATFEPLLKKIKIEGLGGKSSKKIWEDSKIGTVYLSKEADVAASYAEAALDNDLPESWEDKIVVLAIDCTKLDKSKLFLDQNVLDNKGDTLEYVGIIPWDYVINVINY